MASTILYEIFDDDGTMGFIETDCPLEILNNLIAIHILEVTKYNLNALVVHINQIGYKAGVRKEIGIDLGDEFYLKQYEYAKEREIIYEKIAKEEGKKEKENDD